MASKRILRDGEDPEEALKTRDRNRQRLDNVIKDHAAFKQTMTQQMDQVQRDFQAMHNELAYIKDQLQQMGGGLQQIQGLQNDLQSVKSGQQQFSSKLQEVDGLKSKLQSVEGATRDIKSRSEKLESTAKELQGLKGAKEELSKMKNDMRSFNEKTSAFDKMKSELQDVKQMKTELQEAKQGTREITAMKSKMEELKKQAQSNDKLTALEAQVKMNFEEFKTFKQTLYDKGLLAPKVEKPEDPEEPPPVGTVTLGEDAFTARMLVHLGFMKARKDEYMEEQAAKEDAAANRDSTGTYAAMPSEDSDSEEETFIDDDNVHGITDIPVDEDHPGAYFQVTTLWLLICLMTFVIQVLVIAVLISEAKGAGEGCLKKPLPNNDWWLLHISKGLAICVAGVLMGQELMDVLNMAMVSLLVEPRLNPEVLFFAVLRISLALLIAVAYVFIFQYLYHPANVWINMTALGFISEIGTGMLDVARRGVFGHSIMKTMTTLNFELTFVQEYPAWFPTARAIMLGTTSVFIIGCSLYSFAMPDVMCEPEHSVHGGTPSPMFVSPHAGGGGGGHGHGHR